MKAQIFQQRLLESQGTIDQQCRDKQTLVGSAVRLIGGGQLGVRRARPPIANAVHCEGSQLSNRYGSRK